MYLNLSLADCFISLINSSLNPGQLVSQSLNNAPFSLFISTIYSFPKHSDDNNVSLEVYTQNRNLGLGLSTFIRRGYDGLDRVTKYLSFFLELTCIL